MKRTTLANVHAKCLDPQRDENGNLTGSVCAKSRGHDRREVADPRRRLHFDPDHGGVVWGSAADMLAAEVKA